MAKEYDRAPEEPKWSRRARSDWIELVNMAAFGFCFYTLVTNYSDQDIDVVYKKLDFILTFVFGLFVVLFDISAMRRQRKKHKFDLEQYELLRKSWLDLRKRSMETSYTSSQESENIESKIHDEETAV